MAENDRIRTHSLRVWLLPEEKALLQKGAFEANMSQSEYLRKLIVFGGMFVSHFSMDKEQTKQMLYELNRIGNNINQIAYNSNTRGFATQADWKELEVKFSELLKLIGD